jgi:hypothetical protein
MKLHALFLAFLCAAPSVALAQQGPPPPDAGPHGPSSAMRANMQKMMQAHEAFRSSVLAALSSEHKALLAKVVGEMAVAEKPDAKAAAAQLDGALSSAEKQSILSAASQMEAQMKSMRDSMMAQWKSDHPNATPWPARSPRPRPSPDPGRILLMLSGGRGPMMMHGGWGHPPHG